MLDLITEEELNEERSYKDIDKNNGKKLKELIEDKFLNRKECSKYFNCSYKTIYNKIKKYNIKFKQGKSNKQFKWEMKKLVGNRYIPLTEYGKDNKDKILIKHNIESCGHEFKMNPHNFLDNGQRCPKCFGNERKTTEEFKQEIYELEGNDYILLSKYINNNTNVIMKHDIEECGYEYSVRPLHFLEGTRCPKCKASKGEKIIHNWLKDKNIEFENEFVIEKCKNINYLPFDFKIETDDDFILLEYDGIQHYQPIDYFGGIERFKKQKENDEIKNIFCNENNIKLIRIPYWEKENIEKILEEKILN
jgi:predicted Zn-ribbon and HTH transcriptional regulator